VSSPPGWESQAKSERTKTRSSIYRDACQSIIRILKKKMSHHKIYEVKM
jgi:hypothetical protein